MRWYCTYRVDFLLQVDVRIMTGRGNSPCRPLSYSYHYIVHVGISHGLLMALRRSNPTVRKMVLYQSGHGQAQLYLQKDMLIVQQHSTGFLFLPFLLLLFSFSEAVCINMLICQSLYGRGNMSNNICFEEMIYPRKVTGLSVCSEERWCLAHSFYWRGVLSTQACTESGESK